MIDGCTRFGGFVRIILPLAKAGVMTQVVFNGLSIWNEYFMANIMISRPGLRTLPLAIANFAGQHSVNYPELFALLSIVTIPVVLIYILAQRSFIEGISAGAVKG
jgi:raffinose/stachyose/melibiose transport system permease protein